MQLMPGHVQILQRRGAQRWQVRCVIFGVTRHLGDQKLIGLTLYLIGLKTSFSLKSVIGINGCLPLYKEHFRIKLLSIA